MRHGCDFVTITGAVTFGRARESLAPAAKQPFSGSADPCECKCVTWFRTTEQPGSEPVKLYAFYMHFCWKSKPVYGKPVSDVKQAAQPL
jgi:hypothetical protein